MKLRHAALAALVSLGSSGAVAHADRRDASAPQYAPEAHVAALARPAPSALTQVQWRGGWGYPPRYGYGYPYHYRYRYAPYGYGPYGYAPGYRPWYGYGYGPGYYGYGYAPGAPYAYPTPAPFPFGGGFHVWF